MASGIATSQVTVAATTGGTPIVGDRPGRVSSIIINEGTTDVRLGVVGVTTGTGALLAGTKGTALTIPGSSPVYGIVGTGTQVVSVVEVF